MRKPPSLLRSSLCRGTIAHTRRTDPPHHLSRETYMLLLDIDELDALVERLNQDGVRDEQNKAWTVESFRAVMAELGA